MKKINISYGAILAVSLVFFLFGIWYMYYSLNLEGCHGSIWSDGAPCSSYVPPQSNPFAALIIIAMSVGVFLATFIAYLFKD